MNWNRWWVRWFLPVVGLGALLWYLVRVIPKPSRASYPCQRVGLPIALQGILSLTSLLALPPALQRARRFIFQHRYAAGCACLAFCVVCSLVIRNLFESYARAEDTGTFTPSDPPNQPMGTARGIFPGRVAWAYDLNACKWNGSSGYWFSAANNDQARITALMNKTICSVAGQPTIKAAWDTLFKYKNGGAAYVKGEKLAIKLNLNNGGNYDNQIDASPETVYALLDGLVNQFGVNQTDITLCDPARENQCSVVKDYCVAQFPNVNYDSNLGGFTANAFSYSAAGPAETSLSTVIINAKYLITMAILKRHCTPSTTYGTDGVDYGNASVTMIFKSCWGIIGNNRGNQHYLLHDWSYPMASYNQLVDIFGSKHINGKTVLNILDGLYSGDRWSSNPHRWSLAPFSNNWPSSIFVSQDPVALESVGLDFLRAEMPLIKNGDRHLHEAAMANNPPSGTVYKPDGVRLPSLGVHEHWNNPTDKKYSRNLGTGAGIELVNLNQLYSLEISSPVDGSSFSQGTNISIQAAVNNATNTVSQVAFYLNTNQLLGLAGSAPYGVTWSNVPPGGWGLTAVATDALGLCATSQVVKVSVLPPALVWDSDPSTAGPQDGAGAWSSTGSNWWNGAADVAWSSVPAATTFGTGAGAAGTVTLGGPITVGNLIFRPAGSGEYTIAGGGYNLTLTGAPTITVSNGCGPVISAPVSGAGFCKLGGGALTLAGANSYGGTASVSAGTLVLSGDNAPAAAVVASNASLRLSHPGALKGGLTLNNGSSLQLRADTNATFVPSSLSLEPVSDALNIDVSSASGNAVGRMLALSGAFNFSANTDQTINLSGANGYGAVLDAVSVTASTDHNPYRALTINVPPGLALTLGTITSGNYGNYLNLTGGGRITLAGNLANTSNGSLLLYVNGGSTVTLQGVTAKTASGDAYRYFVPNGTLVLDNSAALTNNTTGGGLNQSLFVLGAATNIVASGSLAPAGLLASGNNGYSCALYLGDSDHPNGGLILRSTVTNYVSDGDKGFSNLGTMTIGGQNSAGINTFANPFILGWTPNRGKSVLLIAATGGEVDFSGGLFRNGSDTTAGVTVGDATHSGIVKLAADNTYIGPTIVNTGTLLVTGSLAAGGALSVVGGVLGGVGTINCPVTVQPGGALAPGVGSAVGTLTLNSSLSLAGSLLVKINKSASPSNDLVVVNGALSQAGTNVVVTLTNLGPDLVAGDVFKFFCKPLVGPAVKVQPSVPGPGLAWVNRLATDGSVVVAKTSSLNAANLNARITNGQIALGWPADQIGWWLLEVQTNTSSAKLGTNWCPVADSLGTNQWLAPVAPGLGSVFYRLRLGM